MNLAQNSELCMKECENVIHYFPINHKLIVFALWQSLDAMTYNIFF